MVPSDFGEFEGSSARNQQAGDTPLLVYGVVITKSYWEEKDMEEGGRVKDR